MKTLGRIGQPLRSSPVGFRPRRRARWKMLSAMLAAVLVLLTGLAITANRQVDRGAMTDIAAAAPDRPATGVSRSAHRDGEHLAAADGLALALPHSAPVAVAYHEATRPDALALQPRGRVVSNASSDWTAVAATTGPDYHVLAGETGARPPTSAVDVVVPSGGAIVAPVDGTVVSVTEYPLFDRTRDWRIEVSPQGRPDLRVVLRSLRSPQVTVGDVVVAGETVVAQARVLPFPSAADAVADAGLPRVTMAVRPAVEAGTVDPNEPAAPTVGA